MIIDEDIYLEHFGVKGMRWGVRNDTGKKALTPSEKAKKRKRNVKIATVSFRLAMGAMFIASILASERLQRNQRQAPKFNFKSNSNYNYSRPKTNYSAPKSVKDIINAERDIKMSSLVRMHKEGHMDSEQLKNFSESLNKRYDRKLVDALVK